ncbi:MAG TPA: hypothetical protein PL001_03690, partial [Candidatus Kryptobacter bacterium]|nr:hypothetical protein [Candidatus Kryptobacter bacterium]
MTYKEMVTDNASKFGSGGKPNETHAFLYEADGSARRVVDPADTCHSLKGLSMPNTKRPPLSSTFSKNSHPQLVTHYRKYLSSSLDIEQVD